MTVTDQQPLRGQTPAQMALEDRFEVLKEIGDGSFGSVVLARVRTAGANVARRGSVVAIKSMKKTFDSLAPCLELREVVFLRTIPAHVHLVPALDIFLDPYSKKLHICMEYMEGNLYQLMKARDHKPLDNSSVKSILFQIMQGLEHIHSHQFFHRDIKPENILVSTSAHQDTTNSFRRYSALVTPPSTPPTYTVKLADFGLARETHSKLPYTTYVSTRWYRAPEVLLRAGEYSAPVDIWAVGAMAVEVATLKPLFPGGNEVDQVWRVCEIMGSPGNWYNKNGSRVGGGEWREGTRLASKLGFSFPKMAPHAIDTILKTPQWPASLSHFVTWCLMWDPKARPTSQQAIAHEYFADAVDPLRPKSSASKILGRKQSDLARSIPEKKEPVITASRSSWFRKSLIGRSETPEPIVVKESAARPAAVHATAAAVAAEASAAKARNGGSKRSTWANGFSSNAAPMPILPSIRPISPLSDTVNARANHGQSDAAAAAAAAIANANANANASGQEKKKVSRQLSVASSNNNYTEMHRQQAERALNGQTGLVSPPSAHKESFFSHLRKRARRFSGRHQTPVSPAFEDMEAQVGCAPWPTNNRSSMLSDQQFTSIPKTETYESLDRAMQNHDPRAPLPPMHQYSSTTKLKRHHSLPQQQARSVDNLISAARGGPISSRTRRSQAVYGAQQYEAPDEEDELLDEVLTSTHQAMKRMETDNRKPLRQSASNLGLANPSQPYPSPSPSASGSQVLYEGQEAMAPKPLALNKKSGSQYKWPTPPYEGNEWAGSTPASVWASGNRI